LELAINKGRLNFEIIDTVTLTMTVAFLCFFVNQSLIEFRISQTSNGLQKEACDEIQAAVWWFNIFILVSIFLFTVLVLLQAQINYQEYKHIEMLNFFNIITLILFWIPIRLAIRYQRKFKLRAS
jgi:hypothetical protein